MINDFSALVSTDKHLFVVDLKRMSVLRQIMQGKSFGTILRVSEATFIIEKYNQLYILHQLKPFLVYDMSREGYINGLNIFKQGD